MDVVDGWPIFSSAVAAARCTCAEQVAHGNHVVAIGDQHRQELVYNVDGAGVGIVQQHHRAGFDLGFQHVDGSGGVGVVDPVERDDIPQNFGESLLSGLGAYRLVG